MSWLSIGLCPTCGELYQAHPEPLDRSDQVMESLTEAMVLTRYRQSEERVCGKCDEVEMVDFAKILRESKERREQKLTEPPMNVNAIFPSNYLKASDLQGKQPRVKIDRVELETLGKGKDAEVRPVLYFAGKDKGLALNKTNMTAIAAVFGDETDDWAGAEITLFEMMVDYQGKVTPAIRIKVPPVAPRRPAPPRAPVQEEPPAIDPDDEIPF